MITPKLTDDVTTTGGLVVGSDELAEGYPRSQWTDKRATMPRGGYVFGASNPALRPSVPKGQ